MADNMIELVASLDVDDSAKRINEVDIPKLQEKIKGIKIKSELDTESIASIQSQLANIKINAPQIDLGVGGDSELINNVSHIVDNVEDKIEELRKNLAEKFGVSVDKIVTNTIKNASGQINSFSLDLTKLSGEVERFSYKVSRTKQKNEESGKDYTVTSVKAIGSRDSDKGAIQLLERATKAANTLERQMINLKAAADDVSAPRPITSEESINKVAQAYENAETAVGNLRTANASTFEELNNEAKKAVDELNNVIKAQRNADTAATKLRAKPIEVVKADELSNLDKFVATISNSAIPDVTNLTRRAEELRSELSEVNDKQGLVDYLNKFANVESDFKALVAQAKAVKDALRDLDNLSNNSLFQKNKSDPRVSTTLSDIEAIRKEYGQLFAEIGNAKTPEDLQKISDRLAELKPQFDKVVNSANQFKTALKVGNIEAGRENRIRKLTDDINSYAAANQRAIKSNKEMSNGKIFADEWARIISKMAKGANLTDREIRQLEADLKSFKKNAQTAGEAGASAFEKFGNAFKTISTYISANQIINMVVSQIRSAATELQSVDDRLTEISKTSDRTAESLRKLGETSFDTASKYGRTASDYLLGVQEMSRAGFSEEQSENMAELTVLAQAAGDMTADLANQYLIATNAAYGYNGSIKDLNDALDRQNYVTNRYALSMSDLAEATKIAASQAAQSGIGIDEMTAALATMISSTQQGGEVAARSLRGILMNLQAVKGEVGDGEEDITADSLTKYEKATAELGVALKEVRNGAVALRDPMVVLDELATAFNKESEDSIKRANLLSAVGGKYRANQLAALLQNWDTYRDILNTFNSEQAAGSAMAEAEKSANNWAGSINKLKNSWAELTNEFINSENAIAVIQSVNDIIQRATDSSTIDMLGNVSTILVDIISFLSKIDSLLDKISGQNFSTIALPWLQGLDTIADIKNWIQNAIVTNEEGLEYEEKARKSAVDTVQTIEAEERSITKLSGEYIKLIANSTDVTTQQSGLLSVQENINKSIGEEISSVDLLNKSLSENIKLLEQQKKIDAQKVIEETAGQYQKAIDSLNVGYQLSFDAGFSESDLNAFWAEISNPAYLRSSDYINVFNDTLISGSLYQQRDVLEQMMSIYKDMGDYDEKKYQILSDQWTILNSQISDYEVIVSQYESAQKLLSDLNIPENLEAQFYGLAEDYVEASQKVNELTNQNVPATELQNAIHQMNVYKNALFDAAGGYSELREIALNTVNSIETGNVGLASSLTSLDILQTNFNEVLEGTYKTTLDNVSKIEKSMQSLAEGENIDFDTFKDLVWTIDNEGIIQSIEEVDDKYKLSLDELSKLKDRELIKEINRLKEEISQTKQLRDAEIETAKATVYRLSLASGKTQSTEMSTAITKLNELTSGQNDYTKLIEKDNALIRQLNSHLGMTVDLTKALETRQKALDAQLKSIQSEADAYEKAMTQRIDDIVDGLEEEKGTLESEKDALNEQLEILEERKQVIEDTIENYKKIVNSIEKAVKYEVELLESQQKAEEDAIQSRIDALKELKDEREEENSLLEKELELQQRLADLEKAKSTKVKTYSSELGYHYDVDKEAVANAQSALNNAQKAYDEAVRDKEYNAQIKALEEQKNAVSINYEAQIKAYEDYLESYKAILEEEANVENERLATEILGSDWREKIKNKDVAMLSSFKSDFSAYNSQLKNLVNNEITSLKQSITAKESEIKVIQNQISSWQKYKNQVSNAINEMKSQNEEYVKFLRDITLSEDSSFYDREVNLWNFKERYKLYLDEIAQKQQEINDLADEMNYKLTNADFSGFAEGVNRMAHQVTDTVESILSRLSIVGSHANGGVNSKTGLAMLHGTKTSAETIFNASQSKDLYDMVRTGSFSAQVAERAYDGVASILKSLQTNGDTDNSSRVININGMTIKADNPTQFHNQFMTEINKYWKVTLTQNMVQ